MATGMALHEERAMVMRSISVGEPGRFVTRNMGVGDMLGRRMKLLMEELLVSPQEMEFIGEKYKAQVHYVNFQHYIFTYFERRLELSGGLDRNSTNKKEPLLDEMVETMSAFVAKDAPKTRFPTEMGEATTGANLDKLVQGMLCLYHESHKGDPTKGKDANSGLFTSKEFFHRSEIKSDVSGCQKRTNMNVRFFERGFMSNEEVEKRTEDIRKHMNETNQPSNNLRIFVVGAFSFSPLPIPKQALDCHTLCLFNRSLFRSRTGS